jgi:hypothetical protein
LPKFLAEIRQQQEQPGKPLLTQIEELIDQICFDADASTEKMRNDFFGKRRLIMLHGEWPPFPVAR